MEFGESIFINNCPLPDYLATAGNIPKKIFENSGWPDGNIFVYGSPVIVPRFENRIDCNPLSYISDIPIYADSAKDLRNICDQIVNLPESPVKDEQIKKFLNDYLCFPASDNEYLDKIDSLVQLKN